MPIKNDWNLSILYLKCYSCSIGDYLKVFLHLEGHGVSEYTPWSGLLCGTLRDIPQVLYSSRSTLVLEFHTDRTTSNATGFTGTFRYIDRREYKRSSSSARSLFIYLRLYNSHALFYYHIGWRQSFLIHRHGYTILRYTITTETSSWLYEKVLAKLLGYSSDSVSITRVPFLFFGHALDEISSLSSAPTLCFYEIHLFKYLAIGSSLYKSGLSLSRGESQNLGRPNVVRLLLRNFEIANIETTKDELFKFMGGSQNFERWNVKRLTFRNFKIAHIKITKDDLFDSFIIEFIFSFFINYLNSRNI